MWKVLILSNTNFALRMGSVEETEELYSTRSQLIIQILPRESAAVASKQKSLNSFSSLGVW